MKKNPLFRFLASLKLAVILLVMLAFILATATYYESIYDAKTAHHLVYGHPLFAGFLALLGVNVFCSAIIRYPWKAHQTGFVVTHLGIITILVGSLITQFYGVEGSLALQEGEKGSRVTLDQPVLYFGTGSKSLNEIEAEFRWRPPTQEKPMRIKVSEDYTAVVDRYYHHSVSEVYYEAGDSGLPALKLRIKNQQVDASEWLTTAVGDVPMGPATLSFRRLPDQAATAAFLKGDWESNQGELQLLIGDQPHRLQVSDLGTEPQAVGETGYQVRVLRYLPHAVVREGELVSQSQEPINPTVELEITRGESMQHWLLFARLQEYNTRTASAGEELPVRVLYSMEPKREGRWLEFALAPDGRLLYRFDDGRSGETSPGETLKTGWMGLEATLEEFLPRAQRVSEYRNFVPKKKMAGGEGPPPAIRVTLEGAAQPGPYWLQRGDVKQLPGNPKEKLVIGYGLKTSKLDFEVLLKDFKIGYDPGTQTAASYSSDIEVEGQTYTVAMNEPFYKDDFTFFQASFGDTRPGEAEISVFQVAYDPGIELKYLGSILLVLGIIIQFYIKPLQIKKMMEAKKSKEGLHGEQ